MPSGSSPPTQIHLPAGALPAFCLRGLLLALACITLGGASGCSEAPSDLADQARKLLREQKPQEAIDLLIPAVEDHPGDPELNHVYGLALLQNGQAGLAAWPLRRAAQDDEWRVRSGTRLAQALLMSRNGLEAIREVDLLLSEQPGDPTLLNILARARMQERDFEQVLPVLDELLEGTPRDLKLHEAKLTALLKLERTDAAAGALAEMLEVARARPQLPEATRAYLCSREASIASLRGRTEEAGTLFEQCLARHPGNAEVLRDVVQFYDLEDRTEEATELLHTAALESPEVLSIQTWLASRLHQLGRSEEAEDWLQQVAQSLGTTDAWLALRNFYVANEDLDGAVRAIDGALEALTGKAPDDPSFAYADIDQEFLFQYADILLQAGQFERAREMIVPIQERAYRELLTARLHFEQGDFEAALARWEDAFLLWPSNAVGRYLAARAAMRTRNWSRVLSHLRESIRADAKLTDAGLILARIHLANGRNEAAFEALGHHVRAHPTDIDALRLYSQVSARSGREEVTQALRDNLVSNFGLAPEVLADNARDFAARQGAEAALEYLEQADRDSEAIDLASPDYAAALDVWWELNASLERSEAALLRVAEALSNAPESVPMLVIHAKALATTAQLDAAAESIQRAIELDPEHGPAFLALGGIEIARGDPEAALVAYDTAAGLDPEDPDPAILGATVLAGGEDREVAIQRLQTLLEKWPWRGDAAHMLAHLLIEQGDPSDETLAIANEAVRFLMLSGPGALETLARAHLARDEAEPALDALEQAREMGLQGPSLQFYLGQALARTGHPEAAIEALETALAADNFPHAEAAREELSRVRASLENEAG